MARRPGEHKLDREERLRQPIKVSGKKGSLRYYVGRTRNGWRRWRRIRHRTAERVRNTTDWIGGSYICSICGREVPFRRADRHNRDHRNRMETTQKLRPISQRDRENLPRPPRTPPPPVLPREPSLAKYGPHRPPQGPHGPPQGPRPPQQPPGNRPAGPRRMWRRTTDALGDDMAGRPRQPASNPKPGANGGTPGVPPSSAAAAFLAGVKAWCEYQPTTVSDLRAHLLGMDAAMGQAADMFHQFAATAIVGNKIHPMVAQPIDAAANDVAGIRHHFSAAYFRFEQIYADRLAYERDANKPKPNEAMWKDVG